MENSKKKGNHYSLLKNIFNKDFIMSAIMPIIIFEITQKLSSNLNGLILSGIWCLFIVILNYLMTRNINAIAVIGAIFTAIGLLGTMISNNTTFYLAAPIVEDFLFAVILIISIFLSHPLIQVIAEQSFLKGASSNIKERPSYKSTWTFLTFAWAVINIFQGIIRIIMLNCFSISVYYSISSIYTSISIPLFIAGSILYGKWKMKR